jgi:tetratricopeptide (TPR) repeat protein
LQAGPDRNELRYRILVNRGISRRREKRYQEAAADLALASQINPESHQAHAEFAYALQEQKEFDAAARELDRAIEQAQAAVAAGTLARSVVAKLYINRARFDAERDDFAGAWITSTCRRRAKRPSTLSNLAYRGGFQVQLPATTAILAVPADPRTYIPAAAHRWRAQSLLALRRYDDARKSLDAYFAASGKPDAEVYRLRGLARAERRDLAGALSDYQRALDLDPDDSLTLACRGNAYVVLEAYKPAERDFRRAIELDAANRQAHYGLGYVLVARGDVETGAAHAEDAIRSGPEPMEAGLVLNAARIHGLAVTVKEQERLRLGLSILPDQLRHRDRALALLRQGLELLPASERAAYWQSTVQPDYDRPAGAFWLFRNAPGFRQLATQYEQQGAAARSQ